MRRIPFVDLKAQFADEREALMPVVESCLATGAWVGGEAVERLEADLAARCGRAHAVALNSGTDALILGLKALGIGPGDEVITAPNSFIASAGAIIAVGAVPVFADVRPDQNIDPDAVAAAITPRTRAIMPVHLTGRVADMDAVTAIAARHNLAVVEDAAQSFGARYRGRPAGSFGHVGCFSAHPLKNLNAAGDAGFAVTDDAALAERMRRLRSHGLADRNSAPEWGLVSRMDALQAAILSFRLTRLAGVIERRRANATLYRRHLAAVNAPCRDHEFNTFHLFVIQADDRDGLRSFLAEQGIATAIHYPIPIHLQPAAAGLGYGPGTFPECERQAARILSLPIHQFLTPEDIDFVCDGIIRFMAARGAS
ncbi:MAG: DegT/DnrJ/EryC1/StrS family aminotransferase [Alphaproteobacteria bacterium]|nr:DegT/DnrJ/EryC1/StrS family aminotransferase [Alphaproteobacteria bacterium]